MRLVIASNNAHKAAEMAEVLGLVLGGGISVVMQSDVLSAAEIPDIVEDGDTLEENARIKVQATHAATGEAAVADDTGLEVDALSGAPGIYTARYAGDDADDARNRAKLLAELKGVGEADRGARFRTVVVLRLAGGLVGRTELVAEGSVEGTISTAERGLGGFGYDSLFIPRQSDGRTFAQMQAAQKHAISHRGRALRALAEQLAVYLPADAADLKSW